MGKGIYGGIYCNVIRQIVGVLTVYKSNVGEYPLAQILLGLFLVGSHNTILGYF